MNIDRKNVNIESQKIQSKSSRDGIGCNKLFQITC